MLQDPEKSLTWGLSLPSVEWVCGPQLSAGRRYRSPSGLKPGTPWLQGDPRVGERT